MTWQSVARGVTGIQYFIRQGPNSFPKSTIAWAGSQQRAAVGEINSISPWLLSDEESPTVTSDSKNIVTSSRMHRGRLVVMAVNNRNDNIPSSPEDQQQLSEEQEVMFENRQNNCKLGNHPRPYSSVRKGCLYD
ncbi:MAG: hypothetical protein MZV63_37085 [Marinilabiliales bacterium]|nr:hypothetical protein [Marinilabiliales bacterium]